MKRIKWTKRGCKAARYNAKFEWYRGIFHREVKATVMPCDDGRAMAYIVTPSGRAHWAGRMFPSVPSAKRWASKELKRWIPKELL